MEDNCLAVKRQQLVRFNVGQVPFTLARQTVSAKYPRSLLAKMVEEFSELVDLGEYLFVDRDPKSFPWIVEIYRDGDYKSCIPDMSLEALEKELKFFKLPSMAKLDIAVPKMESLLVPSMSPMAMLFHDILSEVKSCGFLYLLPVDVFVYHEYKDGRISGGERKVLVVAFSDFDAKHISERGHRAFVDTLLEGTKNTCQYLPWGKKLVPPSAKTEFCVVDFLEKAKLDLLNREAIKWEIQCTCCSQPYGQKGEELSLNVLRVQYEGEAS